MTQAQKDFIGYIDGGSLVPYHMINVAYFNRPSDEMTIESFELDNKIYVKSKVGYYVSIVTNAFVRSIYADDYFRVKNIVDLSQVVEPSRVQLVMDFN